jgi:hypothetical protein
VSTNLVPLTVYKGAGHEHIPFAAGSPHITADFHSIRTKTNAPAYVTSGFYKVEAGPKLSAHYAFEEAKYVLSGQIDVYVSLAIRPSTPHKPLSLTIVFRVIRTKQPASRTTS